MIARSLSTFGLLLCAMQVGAAEVPAAGGSAVTLRAGEVSQRSLGPGERHLYAAQLRVGDYLAVEVAELGVDVTLTVLAPDGHSLGEQKTTDSRNDTDAIRLIAAQAGEYQLRVSADTPPAGKYRLRTVAIRGATERDHNEVAASDAFHLAVRLADQGTPSDLHAAIAAYSAAVGFYRTLGDRRAEGQTLVRLGRLHYFLGERDQAIQNTLQAEMRFRSLGDHAREAAALNNLGSMYQDMGEPTKAIEYLARALPILRATRDAYFEANVLHNLGWCRHTLGEFEAAGAYFRRALALWRIAGNRPGEAETLNSLGLLSFHQGDFQRAHETLQQALRLCRQIADQRCAAETLTNLGSLHLALHEPLQGREWFTQALSSTRAAQDEEYEDQALLGLAATDPEPTAAPVLAQIRGALDIAQKLKDRRVEALAQRQLGDWFRARGTYNSAADAYAAALTLQRASADVRGEAETLLALAQLAREAGDLPQARARAEQAIDVVESLRGQVAQPDLRSAYLASTQDYYGVYIDVLMRMHALQPLSGHDREALQASERARARGLLDALAERRAEIMRNVKPQLLERERRLRRQLNARDQRLRAVSAESNDPAQIELAQRDLDTAVNDWRELEGELRASSPRYAELTQPAPIDIAALQHQLDDQSVVLEYWLGSERSFLWVVTRDAVRDYVLPEGPGIESKAREFFASIEARPAMRAGSGQGSGPGLTAERLGHELSSTLLSPVAAQLSHKRLILVLYGALQYLPFAALPEPLAQQGESPPLVHQHEVVSLPSASVLAALRTPRGRTPQKTIAIFADPVFSADDPRVRKASSAPPARTASTGASEDLLHRSVAESGLESLHRLRYSRVEADGIAALVPPAQRLQAVDFQASRGAVLDGSIGQYRILHFATHGLVNSVHPELSGLVFSAVDAQGHPQDALLRLHEIFGLPIRADLVVLSACQTALGREVKGEGLVGLTRGFMYAGAPRVVATLWNVDDRATAELMTRFHRGVLLERLRPAAALRTAQLAMAADERWSSPYYWAGFVLLGDWN